MNEDSRITVMQLLPDLNSGGVEKSTIEMAQALIEKGHRAIVVSAGGTLVPQLEAIGAEHITMDIGRKSFATLKLVTPLRELILREKPDIVHARSRLPAWIGWLALKKLPRKERPLWITTVHGLNSPSFYSKIMTSGDKVIVVSNVVRDYVLKHYKGLDVTKLVVVPRGINPEKYPLRTMGEGKEARALLAETIPEIGGDGPLLLMPGRGTRLKGHHVAIEVTRKLRDQGVDARLWLLGTDDPVRAAYVNELRALVRRLQLEDFVAITEYVPDVAQALSASRVVLQLSRKPEAFGRTVIEALSTGRPVVGWNHGGVGEILGALYPQGLVRAFDANELAEKTMESLDADYWRKSEIPYTLSAMQEATLRVYLDALANRP